MERSADNEAVLAELLGLPIEPRSVTVVAAQKILGMSRTELYRRLARNELRAVKSGAKTMVLVESIRAYEAGLRPATFRAPKTAA